MTNLDSLDHAVHEKCVGREGSRHDVHHRYSEQAPSEELKEYNNDSMEDTRSSPSLKIVRVMYIVLYNVLYIVLYIILYNVHCIVNFIVHCIVPCIVQCIVHYIVQCTLYCKFYCTLYCTLSSNVQ